MTLRWTRELPREPGVYWVRGHRGDAEIVEVRSPGEDILMVFNTAGLPQEPLRQFDDREWAGPLEPPA